MSNASDLTAKFPSAQNRLLCYKEGSAQHKASTLPCLSESNHRSTVIVLHSNPTASSEEEIITENLSGSSLKATWLLQIDHRLSQTWNYWKHSYYGSGWIALQRNCDTGFVPLSQVDDSVDWLLLTRLPASISLSTSPLVALPLTLTRPFSITHLCSTSVAEWISASTSQ